jgi:glycosyltransferase involved in cell wall biosynthesis
MKITVAICTWNRSSLLKQTLKTMCGLACLSDIDWELLVVNNCCNDDTDEVVDTLTANLPLRLIHEAIPGLSNARNKAIEKAKGDYIVWTDDDVLVEKNWLVAYVNAFLKYPETAIFGGPIEPCFEGTPPDWLINNWSCFSSAYAKRDFGDKSIALSVEGNIIPYGANFAVRMSEQRRFKYDPELGLRKTEIILGEEFQVIKSILEHGFSGRWIPEAKVKHWIPQSRQSLDYLKRYYWGCGRTIKICSHPDETSPHILGHPRWFIRQAIEVHLIYIYKKFFCSEKEKFKNFTRMWTARGRLLG